jgi:hypothetical protein
MSSSVRFLSWNINGFFANRLPVLNGFRANYNVIFIQEHFLTKYSETLLKLQEYTSYYVPARQRKNRGRSSGGLGTFFVFPFTLASSKQVITSWLSELKGVYLLTFIYLLIIVVMNPSVVLLYRVRN